MATWNLNNTTHHVLICNGSSCTHVGAEDLTQKYGEKFLKEV